MTTPQPPKPGSSLGKLAESQKDKQPGFQQDTLPVLKVPDAIRNRLHSLDVSAKAQEEAEAAQAQAQPQQPAPQGGMPQMGMPQMGMPQMGMPQVQPMQPQMQPQMGAPMQMMPGMASPMLESAVMQIRDFLVQHNNYFQQVSTYLIQKVDRQEQALTQLSGPQVEMLVDVQKALQYLIQKQQSDEAALQGFVQQGQKDATVIQARVAEVRGIAKNMEDVLQKELAADQETSSQRAAELATAVQEARQAIQQDLGVLGEVHQELTALGPLQEGVAAVRAALEGAVKDLQKLQESHLLAIAEEIRETHDELHAGLKALPGPLLEALRAQDERLAALAGGLPEDLSGLEERLKVAINKLSVSDDLQKIIAVLKSRLETEPVQQLIATTAEVQRTLDSQGKEWHGLKEQLIALVEGITTQSLQYRAVQEAVDALAHGQDLPPSQRQVLEGVQGAVREAREALEERLGALPTVDLEPLRAALDALRQGLGEGQQKLSHGVELLLAAADGGESGGNGGGEGLLSQLNQVLGRMEDLTSEVAGLRSGQEAVDGALDELRAETHALSPLQDTLGQVQEFLTTRNQEAEARQAELESRARDLVAAQEELRRLQAALKEAEERQQTMLRAKEQELRIAMAGREDTEHAIEQTERQHAQEVARLRQHLADKDKEKQQAVDELWKQVEAEKQQRQERIHELEELLKQKEVRRLKELEELQSELKREQERANAGAEAKIDQGLKPEQNIDFLRKFLPTCKLFKNLKPLDVGQLVGLAFYEEAGDNELVIKEGSPAASFYVVVEGSVKLTREKRPGKVEELLTVGPGDVFGEESLINNQPRVATAYTQGPTKMLRFEYDDYHDLTKANSPVIKKLQPNLMRIVNERGF